MRLLPILLPLILAMRTHAALSPTVIFHNAVVRTMDRAQPEAQAIAIYHDRIVAVGANEAIRAMAAAETKVIDVKGRLILPGFNDAHLHFLSGGFQLSGVDLRDAKTPEEFARRIGEYARKLPKGAWVLRGNWDHENWPGARLPTKEMIDAATPETAVFVARLDGHMALANSVALKLAGVGKGTTAPAGGAIIRDENGEPTGLLKDAAMGLVSKVIPERSFEEKLAAARAASEHAASLGVTSAQDMSTGEDLAVYQELMRRGELKTRIYGISPLTRWKDLARVGMQGGFGNEMLKIGGLKAFSDGSLGSSTALFYEPYEGSQTNYGLPSDEMFPEGAMHARVKDADKAGLSVMIHAIGDKANDLVLDIFEKVALENGERDRRFRIEHAQHVRRSDIPRFARQKVIASMQPYHAADDGRWAEKRIGPERIKTTYAFRSLLDEGAVLAFGSDWSVAPMNPLLGIHAAVTRQTLDEKNPAGWVPEEKITVEEAVYAYTTGSAYAEFAEKEKGSIESGKLADLVVLDKDIFSGNPDEIKKTAVIMTVLGGKIIYEK